MGVKPPRSDLIPRIPMRYTAEITTTGGRWFRYRVARHHGVFIPENTHSLHHSLESAQRAARRWVARNDRPQPRVVERV